MTMLATLLSRIGVRSAPTVQPLIQRENPLSEDRVAKIQTQLLAIQSAASRMEQAYLEDADSFVGRHLSALYAHPRPVRALQVHRVLGGMSRFLRRSMPDAVREAGKGFLLVDWIPADGTLCGVARWEGSASTNGYDLLSLAKQSAALFGQFEEATSDQVGHLVVAELSRAEISLPEFAVCLPIGNQARWEWARQQLDVSAADSSKAEEELNRLLEAARPELAAFGLR